MHAQPEPGMPAILEVAPIVNGSSYDIGCCLVHGGDAAAGRVDQALMQLRNHFVEALRSRKTMRAI